MGIKTLNSIRPVDVLLVDDNPNDLYFIKEALKKCRFAVRAKDVRTGEDALAYLRHQGRFSFTIEPDLILLDLNLPRMNGWEVLMQVHEDFQLSHIPILVLTASNYDEDIKRANLLKPDVYMVKPMNLVNFPMLLKSVERLVADRLY